MIVPIKCFITQKTSELLSTPDRVIYSAPQIEIQNKDDIPISNNQSLYRSHNPVAQ